MSNQVMYYTPGTYVWAMLINRVWWPGRVVHRSSVPSQLQYSLNKKKNVKAYVYFEVDNTYITVFNLNYICLYTSANKLHYVKKGHSLYLKQMKLNKNHGFDMSQFVEAVERFENKIGGDPNIFDQFVIRTVQTHRPINIKELFMTEKQRKKYKKSVAAEIQIVRPRKPNKSLCATTLNKQLVGNAQNNVEPLQPKKATEMKTTTYSCYLNVGCNFVTGRFDVLKRHVCAHIDEKKNKVDTIAITGSERIFQKQITSCSTPKVNVNKKSVSGAGNRESVLELVEASQMCDTATIELLTDKKSKPSGSKTAYKRTTNDEYSDLEITYSVHKRVTNWLQKSHEIMKKLNK